MRNSKKHIVFVFILFFAIILSNITIVSSEEQEYDGIYYQTDDEEIIYKTLSDFDFTKKIPMPAIIEIKIIEGISEETPDWVHEIKAHVNDIIKFRITIENTLSYNTIDVNFVNTLPPDSVLKLLENTMTHDETVTIEFEDGGISGSVNDLKIGERAVMEYCMEALVETEINGVTSIITTEALLNLTYEKELKVIEETIFLKKDVLRALVDEIDIYKEKLMLLDEEIEQSKIEEQLAAEKIVLYDAALNALLSEKNLVEEKMRVDGGELGLLIEKEEGFKKDLEDIVFAISNKDAFIASKEAELFEQGNILKEYNEDLLSLKINLEVAYDDKEVDDAIILDLNNQINIKEKIIIETLNSVNQLKEDICILEKNTNDLNDKKVIIAKDIELIVEETTKSTDDLNILRAQEEALSADMDKTFAEIDVEKEKAETLAVKILGTSNIIANLNEDVLLFEDERKILQRDIDATILLINEKNDKINLFSTQSESLELEINDLTNLRNLKTIELGDTQKLILETQNLLDDKNIYLADMQADLVKKEADLLILKDDFDDKTFEQTILNADIIILKNYIAATENTIEALAQQESLLTPVVPNVKK